MAKVSTVRAGARDFRRSHQLTGLAIGQEIVNSIDEGVSQGGVVVIDSRHPHRKVSLDIDSSRVKRYAVLYCGSMVSRSCVVLLQSCTYMLHLHTSYPA